MLRHGQQDDKHKCVGEQRETDSAEVRSVAGVADGKYVDHEDKVRMF